MVLLSSEGRAFTPRAPILINGNADFIPANGVTGGSGTPLDPYVLEGWQINASGVDALVVRNTDAYVVVRNVLILVADNSSRGVYFDNVTHASVQTASVTASSVAVQAYSSSDVTIRDSTLHGTAVGSVSLSRTVGANLTNNDLGSGGVVLFGDSPDHFRSHTIAEDNLVNGKPVRYHRDSSGLTIDGVPTGQLLVVNCTGFLGTNLTITSTSRAVQFAYVDGATLTSSALTNNTLAGLSVLSSANVTASGNQILRNVLGIEVGSTSNITLSNNQVLDNVGWVGNAGRGIFIADSSAIVDGNNVSGNGYGLEVNSPNSTVSNNVVSGNQQFGIGLGGTLNVVVRNNTVSGNRWNGIDVGYSVNITLADNTLLLDGIVLRGSEVQHYASHTLTGNTANGLPVLYYRNCFGATLDAIPAGQVLVADCRNVRIANLTITGTDVAVELAFVDRAQVEGNNLTGNTGEGIYITYSTNETVLQNLLDANANNAIRVERSYEVEIRSNDIESNYQGLWAWSCGNLRVRQNTIRGQSMDGAVVIGCPDLVVADNQITANGRNGLLCGSCTNMTVYGNEIRSSFLSGLDVRFSSGLIVANNISDNGRGILLAAADGIAVHHNNFRGTGLAAEDWGAAAWDDGFPSGGNYWSDYGGTDQCTGPLQDVCPSPDGLGDVPRVLDANSRDGYPLLTSLPSLRIAPPRIIRAFLDGPSLRNLTLEWTPSVNEGLPGPPVSYEVVQSGSVSGPFSPIATVPSNGSALYTFTCLDCGHVLGDFNLSFFRVRAMEGASFMESNTAARYSVAVSSGSNLLSVPLAQSNLSVAYVLRPVTYRTVRAYIATDALDPWKSSPAGRLSDLESLGFGAGFWADVLSAGQYTLAGLVVENPTVTLSAGWNLVSFASFVRRSWESSLAGIAGVARVETFDRASVDLYRLRVLSPGELLLPGEAYWIFMSAGGELWLQG